MTPTNAQIAELLASAAEEQEGHRGRALDRAARAAFYWPEEAAAVHAVGRPLTELALVGPWLARLIASWLDEPPDVPEPPSLRRGFLTLADVRTTLSENPDWLPALRADLQMHTTYSDGKAALPEMVSEARTYGYEHVAITDHSKGLPIARGMDEARLAAQGYEIGRLNEELDASGQSFRVLRAIEMNVSPEGEGDMDIEALRSLDLVLGAFHSKLRVTEDQTDRYVAALRNPTLNVLAHPRGRRFGVRLGLQADWRRVFEAAIEQDKALEIDAYPDRQDLDVELLELARDVGVRISIGTDAHSTSELRFREYGVAAAIRAGISRDRILNYLPRDALLAWAAESRAASR